MLLLKQILIIYTVIKHGFEANYEIKHTCSGRIKPEDGVDPVPETYYALHFNTYDWAVHKFNEFGRHAPLQEL
jgi:hypothetical protein